jgi:hypothetical protein
MENRIMEGGGKGKKRQNSEYRCREPQVFILSFWGHLSGFLLCTKIKSAKFYIYSPLFYAAA